MLGFAKSFAKRLPYPVFLRVFVGWNWLVEMRGCRVAQRQMGLRMLSAEDLAAAKTSATLFLLGSGSSINRSGRCSCGWCRGRPNSRRPPG